jgi:methionine-rich copper-binding protein CopC
MRATAALFVILLVGLSSAVWSQAAVGPILEYSDPLDGTSTNNRGLAIMLKFSDVVNLSGVVVTGPSGVAACTLSFGSDHSILIAKPNQPLPDGAYTVDFSGVRSTKQVPVEGVTSISFAVDATAPYLVASTPSPSQTGVQLNTQIVLKFSEWPAQADTVLPITVSGPSGQVPLQLVSQSKETRTFIWQSATPLDYATQYTVDYSAITDATGNIMAAPGSFTFVTALPPAAVLLTSTPSRGQVCVPLSQPISLRFSMKLDQTSTVSVTTGSTPVDGAVVVNGDTLTFTPASPYTRGAVYAVDFGGVRDLYSRAPAGSTTFSFTAVPPIPLTLTNCSPAKGQSGVSPNQPVVLTFSNDLSQASAITVSANSVPFDGTVSISGNKLTFTPSAAYARDETYTVDFSTVRDIYGQMASGTTSVSFITALPPPFALTGSTPTSGQTEVGMAEPIVLDFSNGLASNSMITVAGGGVPVAGTTIVDGQTATFVPSVPYSLGRTYTVQFSGVRDIYGQSPSGQTAFTFTVVPPAPLALVSAIPANGQPGVLPNSQIVLTFNNPLASTGSAITVRGGGLNIAGALAISGATATFIPTSGYVPGVLYTVQFASIKDIYGQSPSGLTQTTFSAAGDVLDGRADPPVVTTTAGVVAGVTYLIRNLGAAALTLQSSSAEFYVNEQLVGAVNVPAQAGVPANGVAAVSSDVTISQQIQNSAKAAGADEVVMLRRFSSGTEGPEVTIPLVIHIGSSLASPASVTDILLDVPPDSKTVGQGDEIRAHAFIRGTGTGPVVGTWFVDGQPVETFQTNLTAGLAQEVWTRLTLPTVDLGEHGVELRIGRPQPVSSGERRYVVVPKGSGSQRMFLASPSDETTLPQGGVRTSFRWVPMPGSSGYEIAFARTLRALGLNDDGDVLDGPLGRIAWTSAMVQSGELSVLARAPSEALSWTPSAEDYDRLMSAPGTVYWAVRAVYPAEGRGDPSTTSRPVSLMVPPLPQNLGLVAPAEGATVAEGQSFEWQAGPQGSIYEFVILSQGKPVYTALTRECTCALSSRTFSCPAAGAYAWRVSALLPDGVAAVSGRRVFTIAAKPAAKAPVPRPVATGQAIAITTRGVYLLPGAAGGLTITPPNGSVIASQQPLITATYPDAAVGGVCITLNGVDVTALASVTPTSATLQPPGVFSQGDHTVSVTVTTNSGGQLQETSTFTVSLAAASETASAAAAVTAENAPITQRPLQLDLNWNWRPTTAGQQGNDLVFDINLRGEQTWVWRSDSYAAFNFQFAKPGDTEKVDLANFVAHASFRKETYKAVIGDTGLAASELTAQGVMARSFSFVSNAGPVKLNAVHTLGKAIQRSSIGQTPDILLVTAENKGATAQRGLKLTYVDSQSNLAGTSSFVDPTQSRVTSLSGCTPIGKTGLNFRSEVAQSDATVVTAFGSQASSGTALTTTVDGVFAGFGLATSYRRIGSDYVSPASATLTNDIRGWTFAVNRPLGRFLTSTVNYSTYDNLPGSANPAAGLTQRSLDLTANYPKLPVVTVRFARNDSFSDPFAEGGRPGDTRENLWSATANYGASKLNGYLTYSKSDFDDYFDFIDPDVDTPNDRGTGAWSFGFGMNPVKQFKLRADFGANATDRWFRPLLGIDPTQGSDSSHQGRIQAEYVINHKLSATMAWSNSRYSDALGTYVSDFRDFNARINYFLRLTKGGGGLALTGEYRSYRYGGTTAGQNKNEFSILVNDNRVVAF